MTEHTKEPWFHDGDAIYNNADCVGDPIVHVMSCAYDNDINNMDARRIVACVNACAAISTERLEMALPGQMKSSLDRLFAEIEELTSQRDQLLAALEAIIEIHDSARRGSDVSATISNARAAIAAVKGD